MNDVVPHPTFLAAIRSPAFREALPRILAYAARALRGVGWGEGRGHIPGEAEPWDVVNGAIDTCLHGGRTWKEGMSLETFLCGVIWSEVSHRRRGAHPERWADGDDAVEPMAPSSRRADRLAACQRVERIKWAIVGDPEVEQLFASIEDGGERPADHAAALGWTPERVRAVTARLKRRLAAAGLDKDEDSDGSEREGGPRGAPAARQLPGRAAHR